MKRRRILHYANYLINSNDSGPRVGKQLCEGIGGQPEVRWDRNGVIYKEKPPERGPFGSAFPGTLLCSLQKLGQSS